MAHLLSSPGLLKELHQVPEVSGGVHAKAAGGYQQRGVDQQVPASNVMNILAVYCFLGL
jgi:hypothetical protein